MTTLKTGAAATTARFIAVAGLVSASLIGLATASEAATPSLRLSSSTGSSAGGDIITITGKNFMDSAYNNLVLGWDFSSSTCTATATSANQGDGALNVTSATAATLLTPTGTLTAGTWYLCFWDTAAGAASIIGQAKFVTDAPPTITKVNSVADGGGNAVSASSLGGTLVTIEGTNFSRKAKVSIDGVDATKTTYVSTTKVTALLDSHSPSATTYYLKVSTEYGSVTGLSPVTFTGVVEVSPTVGNASTATGVHLTGTNFNTYNATGWATGTGGAAIKYLVAFVPGGITIAATNDLTTATYTNVKYCTTILVDSDTSLSCQTPATLTGAYSVQLLLIAADDTVTTVISVPARAATFTAADL